MGCDRRRSGRGRGHAQAGQCRLGCGGPCRNCQSAHCRWRSWRAGSTYSGLNLENILRQRVGSLGLPERAGGMRGATEAEREAFTSFGKGTTLENARRYVTGLAGGRGGLGALAGISAAGGAGADFGPRSAHLRRTTGLAGLGRPSTAT